MHPKTFSNLIENQSELTITHNNISFRANLNSVTLDIFIYSAVVWLREFVHFKNME